MQLLLATHKRALILSFRAVGILYILVIPSSRHVIRRMLAASRNLHLGAFIILDFGKGEPSPSLTVPPLPKGEAYDPCQKT